MYCIYNGLSETGDVGEETLEWNVPRLADSSLCVCEIGTFECLNIRFLIIDCWLLIVDCSVELLYADCFFEHIGMLDGELTQIDQIELRVRTGTS